MRRLVVAVISIVFTFASDATKAAQNRDIPRFPVKAFCVAAPGPGNVERFNEFVEKHLAVVGVNTLILRVDFKFQFNKHPELIDGNALTRQHVASIRDTCRRLNIRLIPQVNLLGHQSWHEQIGPLLRVYPEFDETPGVQLPDKYKWPNADGLYCKSYCPLHPNVHEVVFACVDEICEAFDADAFHAGMDEVFFIGHPDCPRCHGKDRAKLFADEVNKIHQHLSKSDRELWIWGDRLIDGETTGIGEWEASTNQTHAAIDLVNKDVVICDWHYERANKTPVLFAMKGFRVITATWRQPAVSEQQTIDMLHFRRDSTPKMRKRYLGMMQTVWGSAEGFMNEFENRMERDNDQDQPSVRQTPVKNFIRLFEKMKTLETDAIPLNSNE